VEALCFSFISRKEMRIDPPMRSSSLENVCIVKEPYFKVMNDGGYGLRVDHVSDILWLALNDDRVPLAWQPRVSELKDAEKLKEDGNAALKAGKLHKAVEM